ncbi:recombinase family protein [Serratia sp. JSRIV001]|uniref:recombinase family protein n=1 Tax=Serratia sp. JSRIV001 TaxID=2831893 RepID=UPI001CBD0987|nr:recombinase family protein [Serratia sp. JSRIV001]UAN44290.1 recombinase family protein [Serratia sp. JSRIV001]
MTTYAYSYVRFSSKQQATGASLKRQIEASEAFCKQHNLTLAPLSFHDLGISAYKSKVRASLNELFQAIETGRITPGSYVLIEAIDRLSRKGFDDTHNMLRQILLKGVNVAFVGTDAKSLAGVILNRDSLNDTMSIIQVAISADLAHKESQRKSKLVRDAKKRAKEAVTEGKIAKRRLPFWLELNSDETGYQFNERVSVVKMIVEMRQRGLGKHKIAQTLNEKEIKSSLGKQWSNQTVKHLLTHPALYGAHQLTEQIEDEQIKTVIVENVYPEVISKKEFFLIQFDEKRSSKGVTSSNFPFKGVVRCICGSTIVYGPRKLNNKVYHYYYCAAAKDGSCDQKKLIPDLSEVLKKVIDKVTISSVVKDQTDVIKQEIQAKKDKLGGIQEKLLEMTDPPLSMFEILRNMEKDIERLESQLQAEALKKVGVNNADVKKLASVKDANEYNIQVKRIVDVIQVWRPNLEQNWYRIKIKKIDGNFQGFIMKNGEISMFSDLEAIKALAETE